MPPKGKPSFISRNLVALVMIPSLIGIHFGWQLLQDNRKLVTAEEKIDMPPLTLAKYALRRLTGGADVQADEKPAAE